MYKHLIYLSLFGLLATACIEEKPVPANLLPEETLGKLLIDMYELEAGLLAGNKTEGEVAPEFYEKQQELFTKYDTDSAQYYTTFQYYMDHDFDRFKKTYDGVLDTLNNRRTRVNDAMNKGK